ncbi:uncharacterized protein TRIADDRAFT_56353 [Trichoplax adhaerens]|uniref:VPS37 C-terminal domain-containing protein n=1 Tax=Trichoplax adhaerens TaxID=10228 RepID=B3RXW4_TRIAD|nr:hypothetical protein TRIADDRAFT_56353 [Trichoplax adhaerens]EDV24498.1 hypothetical protein TRIADDRAFT_56353 [Trichoplax adhaerens]|eukprot:XP_002112388.1 hypothetical protein TRIADDRAFT_56353 [Trichoplax adhaerens]
MASWFPSILTGQTQDRPQVPPIPPITALQQQRQKQIDSLFQYNYNVTETVKSQEFRIVASSTNNATYYLNINLPPQFPDEKPILSVYPSCRHPWINEQMIVTGCPAINGFMVHSCLGLAVQQVVKEFQERPPQLYQQTHQSQRNYNSYPSPPSIPDNNMNMPRAINVNDGDVPYNPPMLFKNNTYNKPEVQTKFPKLRSYSTSELKELRGNHEAIEKFIQNLDEVHMIKEDREQILNRCEDIARMNLAKAPELENRRQSLLELYITREEYQKGLDKAFEIQREHLRDYSVDAIYTNLRVATADADEKSEDLAEKFLDSKSLLIFHNILCINERIIEVHLVIVSSGKLYENYLMLQHAWSLVMNCFCSDCNQRFPYSR